MTEDKKFKRGDGELEVADAFSELAAKVAQEHGGEVLVVFQSPESAEPIVITASPTELPTQEHKWTHNGVARGMRWLKQWLDRRGDQRIATFVEFADLWGHEQQANLNAEIAEGRIIPTDKRR